MSTSPLVSFIIASYNHADYVGKCIESILRQEAVQDFEIVVVDDLSTDDTLAVLQIFRDPRLRIIPHTRNQGHVATLNTATAAARGLFIARQDSDNCYRADFLRVTLEIFEKHPQVGLVYGDIAAVDAQGKVIAEPWEGAGARQSHKGQAFCGNEFIPILTKNHVPVVALLVRRQVWMEAFPLPTWLPRLFIADDWYALTRMLRHHDSYYLPKVMADYRLHEYNLHQRFEDGAQQEYAMLRTLDEIFADPERHAEKETVRRTAYAGVYAMLAPRYLGAGNLQEARRCYLQAFRYAPKRLQDGYAVRGFLHTLLGTPRYETWKARLRAA